MTETKVVLVTGVASFWGAQVAARLLALNEPVKQPQYQVIGLDRQPPRAEIKGLDFVQADVRNPLFRELLETEKVHTIVHLDILETSGPSEKAFDLNVIGTMKVMGTAAEAGVRKVVFRSSTAVYGARPTNPAFLTENHPLNGSKTVGTIRNFSEIETFLAGFSKQTPEMLITVLRFANVVGPNVDSPLARYLKLPSPPLLIGFDPLMQVIHEDDALDALIYAVRNDCPGVFNVAAEGTMPLRKLLALTGKFPFPVVHFFAGWGNSLRNAAGLESSKYFPIEPDYLRYPWVSDLARMKTELGFVPSLSGEETLQAYAKAKRKLKRPPGELDLAYDEGTLRDVIELRRQTRARSQPATRSRGGRK